MLPGPSLYFRRSHMASPETIPEPTVHPKNALNDLSGREWIQSTKSVWMQRGLGKDHPDAQIEKQHPAPFSFTDVAKLIGFFSKSGERVLDPFCGVASALKAAACTGRLGVGVELSQDWALLGRRRLDDEADGGHGQELLVGDARDVLPSLDDESFDFVVTSPPYWGILNKKPDHKVKSERVARGRATRYSDDPKDLANIDSYENFLVELVSIFSECYRLLRTGRYMAVVVSDFRHGARLVPFHSDLTQLLETNGWQLQGITVLVQNHKQLYPYGYPYAFVSNIHHQYILILRKP